MKYPKKKPTPKTSFFNNWVSISRASPQAN